jgi:DNA primase large subunit
MKISDYLSRSTLFHEQEWKLINRSVNGGFVYLDVEETVRLVRNELSILIYNKIKDMKITKIPNEIKLQANSIKQNIVIPRHFNSKTLKFPPCINHAIEQLNKNENLPHSARFLLATYMLALGKSIDEIIQLFKNAPDYNEQITRYQIEHLAGKKGSLTKYSVPSCSKLANENLCFYTDECKGITNPIQFGIKRLQKCK